MIMPLKRILWAVLATILLPAISCAEIPDKLAIRAIIGEASNQGFRGMLACACALRNRGTLKGVYGVKAKHVDREPRWVWVQAGKAWEESKTNDITLGATHWENVKAFGTPYWAKSMKKTVKIGNHQFYKEG
jgi:hypothetical protein